MQRHILDYLTPDYVSAFINAPLRGICLFEALADPLDQIIGVLPVTRILPDQFNNLLHDLAACQRHLGRAQNSHAGAEQFGPCRIPGGASGGHNGVQIPCIAQRTQGAVYGVNVIPDLGYAFAKLFGLVK